jgi:lipopolysaccharide transport system ATP-binding protein
MREREIRRRFDEIVAFAEVEKFLDMPVKHYSSGMYVRLGFSVAAHLETEILIVDEVLAVGDAGFQKKSLGKLNEAARGNQTVLIVSHNMNSIRALTQKCILLHQGCIGASGDTDSVITAYLVKTQLPGEAARQPTDLEFFRRSRVNNGPAKITRIQITDFHGQATASAMIPGSKFVIEIQLEVFEAMRSADFCVVIKTADGDTITAFACSDFTSGLSFEPGHHTVRVAINDLPLAPGNYLVRVALDPVIDGEACDLIDNYPLFSVVNTGRIAHWLGRPRVAIQCRAIEWSSSKQI